MNIFVVPYIFNSRLVWWSFQLGKLSNILACWVARSVPWCNSSSPCCCRYVSRTGWTMFWTYVSSNLLPTKNVVTYFISQHDARDLNLCEYTLEDVAPQMFLTRENDYHLQTLRLSVLRYRPKPDLW